MQHEGRLAAYQAYRERDSKSLKDAQLEKYLFSLLECLEVAVDNIGPTELRHKLSEQISDMRAIIWAFDQEKHDG